TLLLITHDRHLIERVTDDQFALVDGKVRHVPAGVDEYLRLLDGRGVARAEAATGKPKSSAPATPRSEEFALKKELASTERKLQTLERKAVAIRDELHAADPSDYVALGDIQGRLHDMERQISDLEDVWVGLSERLS
ncbi:MAG: ABC transporter ATP-binding protein, partial [Coriobacteriia bacterium]|nr:ABC transporter ATP-binding protein [Coriobacteriia bacterium]